MTVLPAPLLGLLLPAVLGHLGGLHPYERVLVAVIAFGPFVVLGVVVHVVRRRDLAAERDEGREGEPRPPGST